jgi:hypothetical protein
MSKPKWQCDVVEREAHNVGDIEFQQILAEIFEHLYRKGASSSDCHNSTGSSQTKVRPSGRTGTDG